MDHDAVPHALPQDKHPGRLQRIIWIFGDMFCKVYTILDNSVGPDTRAVVLVLASVVFM